VLNQRQREFRKSMRQIQRRNKRMGQTDVYGYLEPRFARQSSRISRTYRGYRRSVFVGGASVAVVILLWNVYAISTWIQPHPMTSAKLPSCLSASGNSVFSGTLITQAEVDEYIQTTSAIGQELSGLMKPFLNPNAPLSSQAFADAELKLTQLQQTASINVDVLTPLCLYNLKQISLTQSALQYIRIYHNTRAPSEWQSAEDIVSQYNKNLETEQAIVISILDKMHMPYKVHANGHLTYHYAQSTKP
jgi:hypothetical protein